MLWDAACSIRGAKDAAKFKDYLLPLLFLKRLSDVFDDEIDRLADEYGDRAVAQEIAESDHELLRFYLPPEARWGVVSGRETYDWPLDDRGQSIRPRDIGEHLTRAVRAVVRHNPTLSGVIDLVDFASERNGERDITRPGSPPWWRRSPILDTGSASPTCNPTSWAAPMSTCSASSRKAPARARASSSRPPKSASSWPTSCAQDLARAYRQAESLGCDPHEMISAAVQNALSAIADESGLPARMVARRSEGRVRSRIEKLTPDWRNIMQSSEHLEIPPTVESPYPTEMAQFNDLVDAGDLNGLIARYPLRESNVFDRIAQTMRCADRADYERMLVARSREDDELAGKLKDRIKPLAELLDAEP